jgi:endonuclease-3
LGPTDILAAPSEKLLAIAKLGGVHPEVRAQRLKEIAHIVLNDFDGDVSGVLKLPFAKAIKALRKFPSIGEPGAEKILLFTKAHPVLALESNGLRVLLRLGFGEEKKSYAASYKSVREVLEGQLPADFDFLIGAHELLRRHGKELCRRSNPHCDECPVREECQYYRRLSTRSVG